MIEDGPLAVRVWNPKIYPQDKSHRMPVITPAYPCMCSTHNVTQSTQMVTTAEFGRAAEITEKILHSDGSWETLFSKNDFFHRYKYYLQVIASSDSTEEQNKWSGMVESRLRQLIMKLELVENLEIAHPYVKGFDRNIHCTTEAQKHNAHHGIFNAETEDTKEASEEMEPVTIFTTTFYVGIGVMPKDPNNPSSRKLDISWPTNEFIKMVKSWDQFDVEKMGIVISHIKR